MTLGPRFSAALSFASELHGDQVRKGSNIPYVAHLLSVAALVIEAGGDEDAAIAGLLHDAVEDQGGKPMLAHIARRFGSGVADVVEACTDTDQTPKPPWRERKERYVAAIPAMSSTARLVSLADKVHNARAILADYEVVGEGLWERFTGGREGTLWYYGALVDAFRCRSHSLLWSELERAVSELNALAAAGLNTAGGAPTPASRATA
jgi:GTP pyrophosphokinase